VSAGGSRARWIAVAAAVPVVALIATDVWPGVRGPESWRWERRVCLSPWLPAAVIAAAGTLFAALRVRRAWAGGTVAARAGWLAAAVGLVFAQMVLLTAAEPGGLSNVARRVESPSFTSYDTIARGIADPRAFLEKYPRIQQRFPVHGPSQPPGRVMWFWAARKVAGDAHGPAIAGYLLMLVGAMSLVPLVPLVGGRCAPDAVGAMVALMATLPSFLLFTPETDHLILFLSLASAALLVEAMRYASHRYAPALAFGAGVTAGAGLFVSFTSIAALGAWALAFAGMTAVAHRRRVPFPSLRRTGWLAATALAGTAVAMSAVAWLGMDWAAVFRECLAAARHVQVEVHGRSYATWVTWNLWDFALFLGWPLGVAWIVRVRGEWKDAALEIPFATALLVALVALDLSGSILGETGRIWMFLMPLAVAAAAAGARSPAGWIPLAAAQLAIVLAMRVFLNVPG
jgi:hypothetical protein